MLATAVEELEAGTAGVSGVIIVADVEVAGVVVESDVTGVVEALVDVEALLSVLVAIAGVEVVVMVED